MTWARCSATSGPRPESTHLAPNLNAYINGFLSNVRAVMERFDFGSQIARMADKDLLYLVTKRFAAVDLSPATVDNVEMGYVFEELIRIGAEQSNEEAGEHFTPREVLPHVPDSWIDHAKIKIGYEIPLNRHFYVCEPPRPRKVIERDIKVLETEILALLKEVTA